MAGIYVHIPFCHTKCAYCDFFSTPQTSRIDDFIDALAREWEMRRGELRGDTVKTLYIGGGTPSILSADRLERLLSILPQFPDLEEFTIEANPEDITKEWVEVVSRLGVNRVSMGVQSLIDEELKAVGRRHSAATALDAIATLQGGGIDNISADLIYGLPLQTAESWRKSLTRLLDTGIKHLSAYSLSFEPGTRLYAMLLAGKVQEAPQELSEEMYTTLCAETARHGFTHYEISNFALPSMHSRHNSSYWDATPYLGLGPGAHSYDGTVRRANCSNLKSYIDTLRAGVLPFTIEEESIDDRLNDLIITALRTSFGLDPDMLTVIGGESATRDFMRRAEPYLASGQLLPHPSSQRLYIPEHYWLISDAILRDLMV